jgi:hypothetical protein
MSKYILICDENDSKDDNLIFTNKDDLIAQMASWLDMKVVKE